MKTIAKDVAGFCACQKLRVASRKVTRIYDEALKAAAITPAQFTMLGYIGNSDAVSLTQLAEILGLERTTLTRNLKPLERDGLIDISPQGYRRSRSVSLSNKGLKALEIALPLWHEAQSSLKKQLGSQIWNHIQNDLTKVETII